MQTTITGFFDIDGSPDEVTVPSVGKGPQDYRALDLAIRKRHPRGKRFKRTGSSVEMRDSPEIGRVDLDSGWTLRQLFSSPDGILPDRTSLRIGKVFFSGAPCYVVLTFSRAAGKIGVTLLPRIKMGYGPIVFSNQISPMILTEDLPRIVREVLGNDARALELNTRRAAPLSAPVTTKPLKIPAPPIKVPEKPPEARPEQTRPHTANLPAAVKAAKAVGK